MKKILLILPLLFFISCFSLKITTFPKEDFKKEQIIDNLNQSKEKLFVKANTWMSDIFNNPESVIDFSDKEEGAIVGKYLVYGRIGYSAYGVQTDSRLFAKIDIRLKNNAAKILIEPVSDVPSTGEEYNDAIRFKINELIQDFENSIKSKDDEW